MSNKNKILILLIAVLVCSLIGIYFLDRHNKKTEDPFINIVNSNQLIKESTEKYNSIRVYQQKGQLIVNAESESDFFDGAQFTIPTKGEIDASKVEIIWTTVMGGPVETEGNERVVAEIRVQEEGEIIFDKKINFAKKGMDIVVDMLEKNAKGK